MSTRAKTWTRGLVLGAAVGAAVLVATGCGDDDDSGGGTGGGGDGGGSSARCSVGRVARGCVDLINFSAPANMFESGGLPGTDNLIPGADLAGGMLVPGLGVTSVDPTEGATTSFTVMRDGMVLGSVDCTVGRDAWVSVNPSVVLQQVAGLVTCSDWAY